MLGWYRAHRRDLPWRRTRDPYRIWISEIMLQQTRVAAVLEHYARFTARFPTVRSLADADEAEVLAQWSGLGYYRRARMMHQAAKAVVADHDGRFPETAEELLSLPGIGAYTAAAVASIAFGEAVAVVDGNVERVLTRVAALDAEAADGAGKQPSALAKQIRELAGQLVDPQSPSDFNQAMMELGATICLPRSPLCLQCPVQSLCLTRGEHRTIPRKALEPRDAFFSLIERRRGVLREILMEQRPADISLMAGMWQLPELTTAPAAEPVCIVKHAITVTNYTVRVFEAEAEASPSGRRHDWATKWFLLEEAREQALTGLARKVLKRLRPVGSD